MDDMYTHAREEFFAAVRLLAASTGSIQTRLIDATPAVLRVTIDELEGANELKLKLARILDLLAVDQDEAEAVAIETAAHMTDLEAVRVAALICDFFYELE